MTAATAVTEAAAIVAEAVALLNRAEAVLRRAALHHSGRAIMHAAGDVVEAFNRTASVEAVLPYRVKITRGDSGSEPEPIRYPSGHFPWSPPHTERHPDDKEQQ